MRDIKFRMFSKGRNKIISWEELQKLHVHTVFSMMTPECRLMQYTGLKDKNGVEIYEGDIVKFRSQKHKKYITGVVEYICAEFRISHDYGNPLISGDVYDEQVIGNIHQNPELLS